MINNLYPQGNFVEFPCVSCLAYCILLFCTISSLTRCRKSPPVFFFLRIILPVAEVAASTWHQYPNHSAQVAMPTVQPIQQKPVIDEKELELQVRNSPIYVLSASHRNVFCSGFKTIV